MISSENLYTNNTVHSKEVIVRNISVYTDIYSLHITITVNEKRGYKVKTRSGIWESFVVGGRKGRNVVIMILKK